LNQDPIYGPIHRSILSGFLSNIALRKEKQFYKAARDREAMLFPGSGLFKHPPEWIVAAEMVETSRLYARTAAAIDCSWLEALGKSQCRSSYSDPHWERKKGSVMAKEQVTLYGLIIVSGRKVVYGRIDPKTASEIFIRSALVGQDLTQPLAFMQHNRQMIESVKDLEDRIRRRDMLIEEEGIFDFYQERLPGIYDLAGLEKCIRRIGGDEFLKMKQEDVLIHVPDPDILERYPEKIALGSRQVACSYRFSPGQADDGITVNVPAGTAAGIRPESLQWLVPGLLSEKLGMLLKGLPKAYRKLLVPLNRTAEIIERDLPRQPIPLRMALSRFIKARFGVDVPASAFADEKSLPEHLQMRFAVFDGTGKIVRFGRDPDLLQIQPATGKEPDQFAAASRAWGKNGIRSWDFGDLPDSVPLEGPQGRRWTAYPALVPDHDAVRLRLFSDPSEALRYHLKGVAALFNLHLAKELKFLKRNIILPPELKEAAADVGGRRNVEQQLVESVMRELFYCNIRTQSQFEDCLKDLSDRRIHACGQDRLSAVTALLVAYRGTRSVIAGLSADHRFNPALAAYLMQLQKELKRLVPEKFGLLFGLDRLKQMVRYLKALSVRAQRGVVHLEKDQKRASEIQPFSQALDHLLAGLTPACSEEKRKAVEDFYWMLEEFKISLFAQEIGTALPVSKKRLEARLKEIKGMV
jgi:ATP-dependent helicase HrpA